MSLHTEGWHQAMTAFKSKFEELTFEYERVEAEGERLRNKCDHSQMEVDVLRAALRGVGKDDQIDKAVMQCLPASTCEAPEPVGSPVKLGRRSAELNGDCFRLNSLQTGDDVQVTEVQALHPSGYEGLQDVAGGLINAESAPVKVVEFLEEDTELSPKQNAWATPLHRAKTMGGLAAPQKAGSHLGSNGNSFSSVCPSDAGGTSATTYEVSSMLCVGGLADRSRMAPIGMTATPSSNTSWMAWSGRATTVRTRDDAELGEMTELEATLLEDDGEIGYGKSGTARSGHGEAAKEAKPRPITASWDLSMSANSGNRMRAQTSYFTNKASVARPEQKLRKARIGMQDWTLGTSQGQWLVLGVIGALLVNIGAVLWRIFCKIDEYDNTWRTSFWISWCLFIDPGTQTGFSPSDPWHVHLIAVLLSSCGFLFNLSFLGMIVEIVKSSLARWRKERYRIVRTGHVLILGWTDKTLFLLTETLEKAVQQGTKIVILAERDEIEMKQDIQSHFFNRRDLSRHVISRRGCPFEVDDLDRVSASSARDIIVLDRQGSNSDLEIVRVMVALAALPHEISGKVTSEVRKMEAAPVIEAVLRGAVGVRARGAVGRVLCFMALRPMVADCFVHLCSFKKAEEITVRHAPGVAGKTFGELCYVFKRANLIGLKPLGSDVVLAPPDETIVDETDALVLIAHNTQGSRRKEKKIDAEQRTSIRARASNLIKVLKWRPSGAGHMDISSTQQTAIAEAMNGVANATRLTLVVIGWPIDIVDILAMLERVVNVHTTIHCLSETPLHVREAALSGTQLTQIRLSHHVGERTSVRKLASLPLRDAFCIIILAEDVHAYTSTGSASIDPKVESSDEHAADDAITRDSTCLAVMVTLHGIFEGRFGHTRVRGGHSRIICEVLDPRTDQLLARNKALQEQAIFFRSNALEAGMFARAATEPVSYTVLMCLLAPGNPSGELIAFPCGQLLAPRCSIIEHTTEDDVVGSDEGISFWELHDRIRDRDGGILVGYWRYPTLCWSGPGDDHREGCAVLAPLINRSKKLLWRGGDWLIVITRKSETKKCRAFTVPKTVLEDEDAEDNREKRTSEQDRSSTMTSRMTSKSTEDSG